MPAAGASLSWQPHEPVNEEKATRYHRFRRRALLGSLTTSVALFVALLATDGSRALRDVAFALVSRIGVPAALAPAATLTCYAVILAAVHEGLTFGPNVYLWVIERRYGLVTVPMRRRVWDHATAAVVALTLGVPALVVVYAAIRAWPTTWWVVVGIVGSVIVVWLMKLAPVTLLPLLCHLTPIGRPALRRTLASLVQRAGVTTVGMFEYRLGGLHRRPNAAFVGLGRSRRILLSDTLTRDFSDAEIEVMLAHELAHHVHGDLYRALACDIGLMLVGFYVMHHALIAAAPRLGLQGLDDVAGLPLILLTAGLVSGVFRPIANLLSRHHERRADRYALEMTRNPDAFVSAMRRLGARHLAEYHPSRLIEIIFFSHPSVQRRIALAQQLAQTWGRPLPGRPIS